MGSRGFLPGRALRHRGETLAEAGEQKPPPEASRGAEPAGHERLQQCCLLTCSPRSQWSSVERPGLEGYEKDEEEVVDQDHGSCSRTTVVTAAASAAAE